MGVPVRVIDNEYAGSPASASDTFMYSEGNPRCAIVDIDKRDGQDMTL